jgi:CheY-like chemotaxis protein
MQSMPNQTRISPRTDALRILVLDDHCDSADCLAQLLSLWGHQPCVAYNGPAALELARVHRPDVALLDIAVPGMSGFDVAQRLRAQPESKDVILIAISGYSDPDYRRRSLVYGFRTYFVKPVEPEALRISLEHLRARLIPGARPHLPARPTDRLPIIKRTRGSYPPRIPPT